MKAFTVELKKEFPVLESAQNPHLVCYVNDLFEKRINRPKTPAMIVVPGGGYHTVAQHEGDPIAMCYLRAGFSAFVLNYSIAPQKYPAQLAEISAAMLYIRAHADEWNIDADKIAVTGYSAGGHLAGSLGVMCDDKNVLSILNTTPEKIRPNAMVLCYAVISSDPQIAHLGSFHNVTGIRVNGCDEHKYMSLENHVNELTPPTYMWHTAEDTVVPVQNSLVFAKKLSEYKIPYELHIFPYGAHGISTCDFASCNTVEDMYSAPWVNESIKFLKSVWYK